jgi:hypothetical protein
VVAAGSLDAVWLPRSLYAVMPAMTRMATIAAIQIEPMPAVDALYA